MRSGTFVFGYLWLLRGAFGNTTEVIHQSQLSILDPFYYATGLYSTDDTYRSRLWEPSGFYCDRDGLVCDSDGYVVSIDLHGKRLNGTLPLNISSLVRLQTLRLDDNLLFGKLPESLLRMTSLEHLNLGRNRFHGTFPDVSCLPALRSLKIHQNSFSGTIPTSVCQLTHLQDLDLSECSSLHGTLPSCLAELTGLKMLNITNIGLTGSIPPSLRDGRARNDMDPNPFRCNAIGCQAGTYSQESGQQTREANRCIACRVPSNVIGSTRCGWVPDAEDVTRLAQEDQRRPGHSSGSNPRQSNSPTLSAVLATESPQMHSSTIQPTLWTTNAEPLPGEPTTADARAALPSSNSLVAKGSTIEPTDDSFLDASESKTAPSTGGLVGGSATAGACVVIFLLLLLSRQQSADKDFVKANDENYGRLERNSRERIVRVHVDLPILDSLRSPASLSTIEEEDSAGLSLSESLDALRFPEPTVPQSILTLGEDTKKVRFNVNPVAKSREIGLGISRDDNDAQTNNLSTFGNVDMWAAWIMRGQVFEASNLCGRETKTIAEDERSWVSIDTESGNSETYLLDQADSNLSSSTGSSLRVLGIQERKSDFGDPVTLLEIDERPAKNSASQKYKPTTPTFWNETSSANQGHGTVARSKEDDARSGWRRKGMAEI